MPPQALVPSYDKLRHAMAHSAEMIGTQESLEQNMVKTAEGGTVHIVECFTRNTFSMTHMGHVRSYNVTMETVHALQEIRDEFFDVLNQARPPEQPRDP